MENRAVEIVVAVGTLLVGALWLLEKSRLNSKEVALIAALAALAAFGRIPFAPLPSVQPTTFFVIISGAVFGPLIGLAVGFISPLVSNIFLGHGPWTFFQMLAWGLCGFSAGLLRKHFLGPVKLSLIFFGFTWGYLFGWIMNIWHWYTFVHPVNLSSWLAVSAASFWFDSIHAATNAAFLFVLGPDFIRVLERFKKKLSYSYGFEY